MTGLAYWQALPFWTQTTKDGRSPNSQTQCKQSTSLTHHATKGSMPKIHAEAPQRLSLARATLRQSSKLDVALYLSSESTAEP